MSLRQIADFGLTRTALRIKASTLAKLKVACALVSLFLLSSGEPTRD